MLNEDPLDDNVISDEDDCWEYDYDDLPDELITPKNHKTWMKSRWINLNILRHNFTLLGKLKVPKHFMPDRLDLKTFKVRGKNTG